MMVMTKVVGPMASVMDRSAMFRQNLVDAGCDPQTVTCCMEGFRKSNQLEIERLLKQQRKKLLGDIHAGQKQLDCLDYLLYQLDRDRER